MIRRLHLKFVCINMTIVTIMLCVIFGLVLHFTSASMERECLDMMRSVAMAPHQPGTPGKPGPGISIPYFVIQTSPNGTQIVSGSPYYDLTDKELLDHLLSSATQHSGVLDEYNLRYLRISTPMGQSTVFADISREMSTINHLLQSCLAIGLVSFLLFLLISILLARWAVRPVATAWDQQRQFIADASHELKTPLTVILSNAQMLSGNGDDPELRRKLTGNILTVSEQMKDLVIKLLNCARVDQGIDPMQFSDFDLSDTIANALLPFDAVFYEKELELDSQIQEDLWSHGSPVHISQVVEILLDNAQKYGSPKGCTCVTLRAAGKKGHLLSVENQGPALSPAEQKRIFERFYRADSARERTGSYGLGLPIAHGIVTAHKGKIWVESSGGVNTFFVQLPSISPSNQ